MRKRTIGALCLIVLSHVAQSQKFEPGYYVKNTGDTVRGDIFLKAKSGKTIRLETNTNEAFKPTEISAAGVQGVNYVTGIVMVDKTPKFKEPVPDTVFLEVLTRGKHSLLYFIDEYEKSHFYIQKEDGSKEELGLKILDLGSGLRFQKLTTYKDVLKKNYPTCTSLFPLIEHTGYSKGAINKIFKKLHECAFGKLTEQELKNDTQGEFGIIAGASLTSLSFSPPTIGGRVSLFNFKSSTNFTGGIFYNIKFARIGKLFTVRNELLYRSYSTSSPEITEELIQNQKLSTAYVDASYVKYNLLFRYSFGYGKVSPFINVGPSIALLMNYKEHVHVIPNAFNIPGTPYDEPLLGSASSVDFGVAVGGGILAGDFSVEARGEFSWGPQPKNTQASPVNTVYFLASYTLWKSKPGK